jgi:U3 small nucleolar RNA-associated protein 14
MPKQKALKLRKKGKAFPSKGSAGAEVRARGKSKKTGRGKGQESDEERDGEEEKDPRMTGGGDDDDSLDDDGSEIGWNSDDEATYGHIFNKRKPNEDEEEEEEEGEEEIEGGMLLSDMLSGPTTSQPFQNQESFSGSEEEEEADEEDKNPEDEEEEEEDEDAESDEYAYDDDDDGEANHDQLLAAIEKYSKSAHPSAAHSAPKSNSKLFQLSAESPFSTLQSNQTISLDSLLKSLENPSNNSSASASASASSIDQETLKYIKDNLKTMNTSISAPKYTHKVQSDRTERGVTYQQTATEMNKWQELVRDNKAMKSLDLRQDKRTLPSTRSMITSHEPQTEMEKEIQMILVGNGKKTESDIAQSEEEELLSSKEMSVEEIKEKQRELAKIKSLLFFEQMKRHRINKIKSKTFHKILKKKKLKKQMTSKEYHQMVQKLKNSGDILEEDLQGDDEDGEGGDLEGTRENEEEAIRRIKERMDLRHKNTGRWARMALEHGKGSKSLRSDSPFFSLSLSLILRQGGLS